MFWVCLFGWLCVCCCIFVGFLCFFFWFCFCSFVFVLFVCCWGGGGGGVLLLFTFVCYHLCQPLILSTNETNKRGPAPLSVGFQDLGHNHTLVWALFRFPVNGKHQLLFPSRSRVVRPDGNTPFLSQTAEYGQRKSSHTPAAMSVCDKITGRRSQVICPQSLVTDAGTEGSSKVVYGDSVETNGCDVVVHSILSGRAGGRDWRALRPVVGTASLA